MQRPNCLPDLDAALDLSEEVKTISARELAAKLQEEGEGRLSALGVWADHPFQGCHIVGAQNAIVERLLDEQTGREHCKEVLSKVANGKDSPTLIVYSMYSQGRTLAVVKAIQASASESGIKVDIFLLDGGLHAFVNALCRGQSQISDKPGLLEGTIPENWRMTNCNGFVNTVEVVALEELRESPSMTNAIQANELLSRDVIDDKAVDSKWSCWICG